MHNTWPKLIIAVSSCLVVVVVARLYSNKRVLRSSHPPKKSMSRDHGSGELSVSSVSSREQEPSNDDGPSLSPWKKQAEGDSSQDKLRIQISSDLHIEFYGDAPQVPNDIIIPNAPVLALLGDIGLSFTDSLKAFLHQQADRFETVLFLPGNHEFYNHGADRHTIDEQIAWMKQVCSERENLHYMDRSVLELKGVRILATSLWSEIPDDTLDKAQMSMNDYHICYTERKERDGTFRKLLATETREWHRTNVAWLERELNTSSTQPTIVLTHHTPLIQGTSHPRFDGSDLNSCFSSDLVYLMRPHIKAWACGHTHYNFDLSVAHGVRLVSNQRGYPHTKEDDNYEADGVIIVVAAAVAAEPDGKSSP